MSPPMVGGGATPVGHVPVAAGGPAPSGGVPSPVFPQQGLMSPVPGQQVQEALMHEVNRDSPDKSVETAYRKTARRAHPDKGGSLADMQRLQAAREDWQSAKAKSASSAPSRQCGQKQKPVLPLQSAGAKKPFLIRSSSVLLTYHIYSGYDLPE